jgi:hypothetical protein
LIRHISVIFSKIEVDTLEWAGILGRMNALSDYSVAELRRALALKEQIEALEQQLQELTGEAAEAAPAEAPVPAKRKLSPAHRRKLIKALARARKIRWAMARAAGKAPAAKKRRRLSAASRAALSAAAKARWAKFRAERAAA